MQATVTAATNYTIHCVQYIVAGNYSASIAAPDGSFSYTYSGNSMTPVLVPEACTALDAGSINIDIITEFSGNSTEYMLGYNTFYVPSASVCDQID